MARKFQRRERPSHDQSRLRDILKRNRLSRLHYKCVNQDLRLRDILKRNRLSRLYYKCVNQDLRLRDILRTAVFLVPSL